ncbi:XrtA/PEP-CTERM system TPR-repeat protein PrsT [Massilia yuzhufengensis]|uniref:Putative PEP-CTERM system TPR-repeat lipoprotein n=1 Tax=Massilia yuzhufengensis TaxID=1164594 RepID=A0A1I1DL25_9BURK|nr:XrtA/PEP-CTERM system TPR-repeat protein PrsT [Massilia yuzhufengensis]SFB75567.1 putative PEP-CTERM system TPR-repeat lipoprotein [Massilia yuzhufengensis]
MRRSTKHVLRASVVLSTMLALAGVTGCSKEQSSASLLADAKQYQQKGDHKAALIQLKNAATSNPEDGDIRVELARSYLDSGDPVSAEKEIRKAASLKVDQGRTSPLLARSLLMQGQAQQALDATKDAPPGPELLTARGDAFAATGAEAKAVEAYEAALAAKPDAPGPLLGMARLAMARKDAAGADAHLEKALAANPKDPGVWMFKGTLLRMTGRTDAALAAYDQVIKLKPDHMNALVERAQFHIDAQKYDLAQADLSAARKVAPNAVIVRYTDALLSFKQNKFTAARDSLQQVTKVAPNYMPAVLLSGAVDLNLGSYQQAEQQLQRFVNAFPNHAYARKLLAQAQLQSARPAEATATLAPLLKDGENDGQLLALAGMSAAQSQDFSKATSYFERASAIDPKSAALRTSLGLSRISGGNAEAGIGELSKAVELNPASVETVLALMRAELSQRQFDKALAVAARAEKQHAGNFAFQNLKGAAYASKGDMANARASFEKAATLKPDDFAPVVNLAKMDYAEKGPAAAKQRLEAFVAKNKKHMTAMFALAELAGGQGQKEQATAWLEKAAAENPSATEPVVRLGAHYLATGKADKALTLARKARSTAPQNPQLADLLGQSQIANKDFTGALETYSALAAAAPKSAPVHMRLARVHVLLKDPAAAAADLKRAVELQPDYLPARLAQVELAVGTGKMDQALAMAREMQSINPKSPIGFAVEGDIHTQLKRFDQALVSYKKSALLGKTPATAIKVAQTLRLSGKDKEAENYLVEWSKANPNDALTRTYLAEMLLARKQYKEAAQLFEGLLAHEPDNVVLLNNLAWTYQQAKDPRAMATAERAAKLAPDNPAVLDTLGWILAEQGNTARALPLLKKSLAAAPDAPGTRYHFAATLHKSGDKASARKELEKLLADNKPFAEAEQAKALLKLL